MSRLLSDIHGYFHGLHEKDKPLPCAFRDAASLAQCSRDLEDTVEFVCGFVRNSAKSTTPAPLSEVHDRTTSRILHTWPKLFYNNGFLPAMRLPYKHTVDTTGYWLPLLLIGFGLIIAVTALFCVWPALKYFFPSKDSQDPLDGVVKLLRDSERNFDRVTIKSPKFYAKTVPRTSVTDVCRITMTADRDVNSSQAPSLWGPAEGARKSRRSAQFTRDAIFDSLRRSTHHVRLDGRSSHYGLHTCNEPLFTIDLEKFRTRVGDRDCVIGVPTDCEDQVISDLKSLREAHGFRALPKVEVSESVPSVTVSDSLEVRAEESDLTSVVGKNLRANTRLCSQYEDRLIGFRTSLRSSTHPSGASQAQSDYSKSLRLGCPSQFEWHIRQNVTMIAILIFCLSLIALVVAEISTQHLYATHAEHLCAIVREPYNLLYTEGIPTSHGREFKGLLAWLDGMSLIRGQLMSWIEILHGYENNANRLWQELSMSVYSGVLWTDQNVRSQKYSGWKDHLGKSQPFSFGLRLHGSDALARGIQIPSSICISTPEALCFSDFYRKLGAAVLSGPLSEMAEKLARTQLTLTAFMDAVESLLQPLSDGIAAAWEEMPGTFLLYGGGAHILLLVFFAIVGIYSFAGLYILAVYKRNSCKVNKFQILCGYSLAALGLVAAGVLSSIFLWYGEGCLLLDDVLLTQGRYDEVFNLSVLSGLPIEKCTLDKSDGRVQDAYHAAFVDDIPVLSDDIWRAWIDILINEMSSVHDIDYSSASPSISDRRLIMPRLQKPPDFEATAHGALTKHLITDIRAFLDRLNEEVEDQYPYRFCTPLLECPATSSKDKPTAIISPFTVFNAPGTNIPSEITEDPYLAAAFQHWPHSTQSLIDAFYFIASASAIEYEWLRLPDKLGSPSDFSIVPSLISPPAIPSSPFLSTRFHTGALNITRTNYTFWNASFEENAESLDNMARVDTLLRALAQFGREHTFREAMRKSTDYLEKHWSCDVFADSAKRIYAAGCDGVMADVGRLTVSRLALSLLLLTASSCLMCLWGKTLKTSPSEPQEKTH